MTHEERLMKKAFIAGRDSDIKFENWMDLYRYSRDKDKTAFINIIASVLKDSSEYIFNCKVEEYLDSRKLEHATIKHLVRGCIYGELPYTITLKQIGEIEHKAGSNTKTHHSTIINSIEEYYKIADKPSNRRKVDKLKSRIINYIDQHENSLL